jgi:hypothetical protein
MTFPELLTSLGFEERDDVKDPDDPRNTYWYETDGTATASVTYDTDGTILFGVYVHSEDRHLTVIAGNYTLFEITHQPLWFARQEIRKAINIGRVTLERERLSKAR